MLKPKIFPHVFTYFFVANGGLLGASTLVRRVASRVQGMNDAWTLKAALGGDVRRRLRPRMGSCGSSPSIAHVLSGVARLHGGTSNSIEGWYVIDEERDRCTLNPATFSNALELNWENKMMCVTTFFAQSDSRHPFVRGSRLTVSFLLAPQSCVRLHTSRSRGGVNLHTVLARDSVPSSSAFAWCFKRLLQRLAASWMTTSAEEFVRDE